MPVGITIDREMLAAFCRRWKIRELALFGSVLRDDFDPDSDVDVLVEFDADAVVGYFELAQMELEFSEILGRKADIRTPAELSRYFRQRVLESAETLYATGR